jgi:DNA-binding transcriptional ArsR family regulator
MLNHDSQLDLMFHALADSGRRSMLQRLGSGPCSVSELARPLSMSLAGVVQHVLLYADGSRISVSVASIEMLEAAAATTLIWTEQGAFLDGLDTSELREGGTSWMIDNMAEYFDARSS